MPLASRRSTALPNRAGLPAAPGAIPILTFTRLSDTGLSDTGLSDHDGTDLAHPDCRARLRSRAYQETASPEARADLRCDEGDAKLARGTADSGRRPRPGSNRERAGAGQRAPAAWSDADVVRLPPAAGSCRPRPAAYFSHHIQARLIRFQVDRL